jgi:hypothetical protein
MNDKIEVLENSFAIMVTKVPKELEKQVLMSKLESIQESPIISEKAKFLIQIAKDRVFIFEQPEKGEVL